MKRIKVGCILTTPPPKINRAPKEGESVCKYCGNPFVAESKEEFCTYGCMVAWTDRRKR